MRSANLRLRTVDSRRTAALSGVGRTSHAASSPPTHARPSRAASHPCAPSLSLPDRRIAGHAERMDGLDSSAQRQRAKVLRTDLGRRVTAESVAIICARLLGPDRTIVSLRMRPSEAIAARWCGGRIAGNPDPRLGRTPECLPHLASAPQFCGDGKEPAAANRPT